MIRRQKPRRPISRQTLQAPAQKRRSFSALKAAFDLADRDSELDEQFARAKFESGRTALPPVDRRTMIDRSRYEIFQANPWLRGSARSTTVSVVGRGPEIEVSIPDDKETSKAVEKEFNAWMKRVKAGRKMRAMANAKQSDGAGLAICFTNKRRPDGEIQLDFAPFDVDHVKAPLFSDTTIRFRCLDGKDIDDSGEAVRYWITPEHPAENPLTEPKAVDAKYILDVWDWTRPSQSHGVPEYATTIKNGPLARSFRRATLDAATTAAKHSGVLSTNVDRFDDGSMALSPMDEWIQVPTPYGTFTALPAGWIMEQMKSENPNENHTAFMKSLAQEHGRAVNQPGFLALLDGSDVNMSSMAGLRQEWEIEVDVQRQEWETEALDKLFTLWLEEAAALGKFGGKVKTIEDAPHSWRWKKRRHQDTNKEYSGRKAAITSGTRSRLQWQIDDGLDPQQEDADAATGFGVTEEIYRKALFLSTFGDAARAAMGLPTQVDVQLQVVKNQKQGATGDDKTNAER